MQELERSIRERAYHLWIADGCRDGRADTHWLEVLARSHGGIARVTIAETPAVSTPSDKKPRKAKAVSKAKGKQRAA